MVKKRKVLSPLLEPSSKLILDEHSNEETEDEESTEEESESESESSEEEELEEEEEEEEEEEDDDKEEDDDDELKEEPSEEEANQEDDDTNEESSEDGAEEEESKRATLRELLEPFGKSQIIDILKRAAADDQNILPEIMRIADSDTAHRKLFVFGLGWDVTNDQLLQVFKSFGELEECKLITDKNTGRCKGYAFVLFKARAAAKKALKIPQKKIGNRMASCQLAAFGQGAASDVGSRKIYIGNVGPHLNPEKLYSFFTRFGEIEERPLGFDPVTNKFKGYAILTFKSVDGYKKAMEEPIKELENCQLHCKKFIENQNKNNVSAKTSSLNMNSAVTVEDTCLRLSGGILGNSVDARGLVMPQNQGIGLMGNPALALAYNPVGLVATTPLAGASGNNGMNSYNPNMMGSYGAQGALQGMGIFQNAYVGQSSEVTATRGLTSIVSAPTIYPSYVSRN